MASFSRILALAICLPLSAGAGTLRCGEKLITNGTSQAEVAARCGQPTQIDHQETYGEQAGMVSPAAPPMRALPPTGPAGPIGPIGGRSGTETRVEIWTYNFGPTRLMQRIRFEDGEVVQIESLGYGF